jgi:hypothetical protein
VAICTITKCTLAILIQKLISGCAITLLLFLSSTSV